ncbi:MAG: SDR family oxidoreductase [Candidatus Marinimicrobia bacterium]|nr:SDR family oxidoreductase [Candidatus Neomarinimicrobiota bacterium]
MNKPLKVGITGQAGFVGTHLYNQFGLSQEYERIPFEDSFFDDPSELERFVRTCDVIVHLAAVNRHSDAEILYSTNISLVEKVIQTCENTGSKPHILFSSSTQEERGNPYGKSKYDGRKLFEAWAKKNKMGFTGLVIPNVYGPFGNPYYNSVIATFCHQLTHEETPCIEVDAQVKFIYVNELVQHIIHAIGGREKAIQTLNIPHTIEMQVSKILDKLVGFKELYFDKGIFPDLDCPFDRNLFNTFLCYIDHERFFPIALKLNQDNRGSFVETMRLNSGGQVSFSTTKPGIIRGNHFHTRKAERFAVIKGRALIELRKIGSSKVMTFELDGNQPACVDMPIWHTHNIKNIGEGDLFTIFWINEQYNHNDPDTFHEVVSKTP